MSLRSELNDHTNTLQEARMLDRGRHGKTPTHAAILIRSPTATPLSRTLYLMIDFQRVLHTLGHGQARIILRLEGE
jgi:hypothetical protein